VIYPKRCSHTTKAQRHYRKGRNLLRSRMARRPVGRDRSFPG
jgi:hypothetical protein